jgi:hypothetical protein
MRESGATDAEVKRGANFVAAVELEDVADVVEDYRIEVEAFDQGRIFRMWKLCPGADWQVFGANDWLDVGL